METLKLKHQRQDDFTRQSQAMKAMVKNQQDKKLVELQERTSKFQRQDLKILKKKEMDVKKR